MNTAKKYRAVRTARYFHRSFLFTRIITEHTIISTAAEIAVTVHNNACSLIFSLTDLFTFFTSFGFFSIAINKIIFAYKLSNNA